MPEKKKIDELLDIQFADKVQGFVRVAYPSPVEIEIEGKKEEALPYTFEDALVFDNLEFFKVLNRRGMIKTFGKKIREEKSAESLGQALFEELKKGNKAEFALELLYLKEPKELKVPSYINEGLTWLQEQLESKQKVADAQGGKNNAK